MTSLIQAFLNDLVVTIHRRNGGSLRELNFDLPLLHRDFCLDSLDLAEIMATVEKKFGRSPFDAANSPRTWRDVVVFLEQEGK